MNQDLKVSIKSNLLQKKTIAYGIGGSIAANESIKIIRQLRRHQAEVKIFPTKNALKFITKHSLIWASNNNLQDKLTGKAEHISSIDLLLIAPATLNTINKIAGGIADSPLNTLVQNILGYNQNNPKKIPILFFPAMHINLHHNPFYQESKKKLTNLGCIFLNPKEFQDEEKIKCPSEEYITAQVLHHIYALKKKAELLITAGAVPSLIDEVRIVSNLASGHTGIELAKKNFYRGIITHLLVPESLEKQIPCFLEKVSYFKDFIDYQKLVFKKLEENPSIQLGIFTAAVSDFKIESSLNKLTKNKFTGKISSKRSYPVELMPNGKVIQLIKETHPQLPLFIFKLETKKLPQEIEVLAQKLLKDFSYVIINLLEELKEFKKYFFSKKEKKTLKSLDELAEVILKIVSP